MSRVFLLLFVLPRLDGLLGQPAFLSGQLYGVPGQLLGLGRLGLRRLHRVYGIPRFGGGSRGGYAPLRQTGGTAALHGPLALPAPPALRRGAERV